MTQEELRAFVNEGNQKNIQPFIERLTHLVCEAYEAGVLFGIEVANKSFQVE
jgi:hypothetical protein